jgi:hypothetical protein
VSNGPQLDREPAEFAASTAPRSKSAIWPNGPQCALSETAFIDAGYRLFAPLADGAQIRKHIHVECRLDGTKGPQLAFSALSAFGAAILHDIAEQVERLR